MAIGWPVSGSNLADEEVSIWVLLPQGITELLTTELSLIMLQKLGGLFWIHSLPLVEHVPPSVVGQIYCPFLLLRVCGGIGRGSACAAAPPSNGVKFKYVCVQVHHWTDTAGGSALLLYFNLWIHVDFTRHFYIHQLVTISICYKVWTANDIACKPFRTYYQKHILAIYYFFSITYQCQNMVKHSHILTLSL